MKVRKYWSAVTLSFLLLLGTSSLLLAQEERRDEAKPQDEAKPNQPAPRQDAKSPRQDEPRQGEAKPSEQSEDKTTRSEDKSGRSEDKSAPRDDAKSRGGREQGQAQNQSNDHAQGNMGRRGGHIPDDRFRASFGRQHTFKVQRLAVVEGQSTFQYGGYSFALIDVWPTGWAYTDDCYVDYIDGDYYLIDLVHPDIRLAIVVVL